MFNPYSTYVWHVHLADIAHSEGLSVHLPSAPHSPQDFLQVSAMYLMYFPDSQNPASAQPGQPSLLSSHLGFVGLVVGLGASPSQYNLLMPTMSDLLKPFLWPSVAPLLDMIVFLPPMPKAVAP